MFAEHERDLAGFGALNAEHRRLVREMVGLLGKMEREEGR
jgi:hypothetical protein